MHILRFLWSPVSLIATLAALALLVAVASGTSDSAAAHTTSADGNHFTWVIKLPFGSFYSVNVKDRAGTSEYKSDSVMNTYHHTNTVYAANGWCQYAYPFCFTPPSQPKTVYSNSSTTYNLTSWYQESCILPYKSHGKCWSSSVGLAWFNWPVNANASRKIGMYHWPQYAWFPCYCSSKTFNTPAYTTY